MPLYKKSILRVGTYHSPDGTVEVTPERLKHWALMHRKLRANRQVVPIDWDHTEDPTTAIPMSADSFNRNRRSAKNTVGHLRRFKVSKDGKSAEIVMDIHRKTAAEAADANSVFVSPVIFDSWKDGDGNEYDDVITHVDFVNHPVDASQSEFEPAEEGAVACALRFGLDVGHPKVYRLKLELDDEDDDDDVDVDVDIDTDDDDSDDDFAGGDFDFGDDDDDEILEMGDDEPVLDQDMPALQGDEVLAQQISSDLEAAGIAPPEGVDPIADAKEFLAQLCAALRQKAMDEGNTNEPDGLDDTLDNSFDQGGELVETSPDFAALSLRVKNAEAKSSATEQTLIRMARQAKLRDLTTLLDSGRINADEFNSHSKGLKALAMSLDTNGKPNRVELDAFIEARKAVPAGSMWPADSELRLSLDAKLTEPPEPTGVVSQEDAKKFVDEQAARMGGMITS